jgi:hypothetical protein
MISGFLLSWNHHLFGSEVNKKVNTKSKAMIQLPNNCSCSELNVYPKNWKTPKANLKGNGVYPTVSTIPDM